MDNVLESLERLKNAPSFMGGTTEYQSCTDSKTLLMQDYEIVKQALKRLESIDNANPSEALKCLGLLGDFEWRKKSFKEAFPDLFGTIEQALLKAQENARSEEILQKYYQEGITLDSVRALKQERDNYKKVLEILKEKRVDLPYLRCCIEDNQTVYRYNEYIRDKTMDYDHEEELTEEDFETLKEVLDNE